MTGRRGRGAFAAFVGVMAAAVLALSPGDSAAVVGGVGSEPGDHPWLISLQDVEGHLCAGSVIGERIVLTSAHCTEGFTADDLLVRAGVIAHADRSGQDRAVVDIVDHEQYAVRGVADLSMLVLDRPLALGGAVRAIELATPSEVERATTGVVAGWGARSENDQGMPDRLLEAEVALVADAECSRAVDGIDAVAEMCAGGGGADTCYGDSGGPLVIPGRAGGPRLAGVSSWGLECGGPAPGVYAEVAPFADWIVPRLEAPDTPGPPRPDDDGWDDDGWDDDGWDDDGWDDDGWDDDGWCDDGRWA